MRSVSKAHVVIRHKARECVGCCLCEEIIPQYFQMNSEGLATLQNAKPDGVFFRATALSVDSTQIEAAIKGCPVDIIRVDAT